ALISAARAAAAARTAAQFGVNTGSVSADFSVAMDRLRRLRAELAENDSIARLSGLGIDVFLGQARFVARDEVEVDGRRLRFTRAIIATGARASVPSIPGLVEAGFLTNESVFSLTVLPVRLVVIGAGPIGCELAQAFRRFGSEVTLVGDGARILPREDPDAAAVLATAFEREGIKTLLNAKVTRVDGQGGSGERRLVIEQRGAEIVLGADAVLVSVGRTPNVDGLDLERAGISSNPQGVIVNDQQRTANRRVFAIGDVASRFKFTHAADAMARLAIQNALFFGRKKASALVIPWATYTEPEVAHVGLTADEAAKRPDVKSFTVELAQNDRALLDGQSEGFTRIHADKRGRILGATMVASHAGEMIGEMSLAMTAGVRLSTLGQTIHPYPTQSECWKKLGDAWSRTRVTPRVRAAFDRFLRWRR
ncbi:MAG: FAD-dependent oxidoreductase, partial [Vicinamibacteria bacterium]